MQDEDTPDIEYIYEDEDSFGAEIAELYSYTEGPEFPLAQKAFEDEATSFKLPATWSAMSEEQKRSMIQLLLDRTEVADRDERLAAIRGRCWPLIKINVKRDCLPLQILNYFQGYCTFAKVVG